MSILDAFLNRGFKGAKCKTLLKLAIPRIKLLRNRREIQLKQMRRDIAKLLENGQEASARIRVEHIIREENLMAAQEIIELFCELITVRLPIIETQRECPLDLKEAISSICFAAPRCSDLPELQEVQMLFAAKYGKEFVAAASELMPECGVNRQIIELLSVRAPSVEAKLQLLKEIAEEHELDWDPAASESEFLKPHADLLNGPSHFISGSTMPLPKEKHDASLSSVSAKDSDGESDTDAFFDSLDLPEVPRVSVQASSDTPYSPDIFPHKPVTSCHLEPGHEVTKSSPPNNAASHIPLVGPDIDGSDPSLPYLCTPNDSVAERENKQFIPFVLSPLPPSVSPPAKQDPASSSQNKSKDHIDLPSVSPSLSWDKSVANVDSPWMPSDSFAAKQNDHTPFVQQTETADSVDPSLHYLFTPNASVADQEDKQCIPFVSSPLMPSVSSLKKHGPAPSSQYKSKDHVDLPSVSPSLSWISGANVDSPLMPSDSFSLKQNEHTPFIPLAETADSMNLQDVVAAAHAAAETAERAAAAARAAASLAQVRITELVTRRNSTPEDTNNVFHTEYSGWVDVSETPASDQQNSFGDTSYEPAQYLGSQTLSSTDLLKTVAESQDFKGQRPDHKSARQPERLTSLEDDPYFSYPNLFSSQDATVTIKSDSHYFSQNY